MSKITLRKLEQEELQGEFDIYLNHNFPGFKFLEIEYEIAYTLKKVDQIRYNFEFVAWLDEQVKNGQLVEIQTEYYIQLK